MTMFLVTVCNLVTREYQIECDDDAEAIERALSSHDFRLPADDKWSVVSKPYVPDGGVVLDEGEETTGP